jgi:hypothetical protein
MLWTAPPPAASALRDFSGNPPNTPQEFADFASFFAADAVTKLFA